MFLNDNTRCENCAHLKRDKDGKPHICSGNNPRCMKWYALVRADGFCNHFKLYVDCDFCPAQKFCNSDTGIRYDDPETYCRDVMRVWKETAPVIVKTNFALYKEKLIVEDMFCYYQERKKPPSGSVMVTICEKCPAESSCTRDCIGTFKRWANELIGTGIPITNFEAWRDNLTIDHILKGEYDCDDGTCLAAEFCKAHGGCEGLGDIGCPQVIRRWAEEVTEILVTRKEGS